MPELDFNLITARPIALELDQNNQRLPVIPAGVQFNTEFLFQGTITGIQTIANLVAKANGGSGPIWLDMVPKAWTSLWGEYTIINYDTANSLDILMLLPGPGGGTYLKGTFVPGGGYNEINRELNPSAILVRPTSPATTCVVFIDGWCYGSTK